MKNYEKLGVFYLGKAYDLEKRVMGEDLILYDSKDLTTHGVCVGMTGSGKTGICLSILEEAAIDGIPTIAIDPKGDLGNLMLTFPELRPSDFLPWIDQAEATRKGLAPEAYAKATAEQWQKGLAEWGQDGSRIGLFQQTVDVALYTPGSTAGLPLNVIRSLDAPKSEISKDMEAVRDRIQSSVSGILGILGIQADPIRSREHVLLSNILDRSWQEGRHLDLPGLIRLTQSPPFDRIGIFDLDSFYPARDRFDLAMRMNNLLASPGFAPWLEGEPLDVGRLLYTPSGRPRISILSIAHLSEAERMFFVTLLLNEVVAWMRSQAGTPSLRALLYMDEIFGYFPPTAMPPSKQPMLTLLKQARAYGLGVLLATQNPVDLDYKGLSNTGTWFIGRLQTERDKMRVLEGLEGASVTTGASFDRSRMEKLLAALGTRVFLMHNVHENEPRVFHTRWLLSYLRGPLTRTQIRTLVASRTRPREVPAFPTPAPPVSPAEPVTEPDAMTAGTDRPVLPPDIKEYFLPLKQEVGMDARLLYRPSLTGSVRLHYVSSKFGFDEWMTLSFLSPLPEVNPEIDWDAATTLEGEEITLHQAPAPEARFSPLPAEVTRANYYATSRKTLAHYLYQSKPLQLWRCPEIKQTSLPGEDEGVFRGRMIHLAREKRDLEVERLRKKYATLLGSIQDRVRRTEERVEREKSQYGQSKIQTAISLGATLVGALFGRKAVSSGTIGRATTVARNAGRAAREKGDVARAEEELQVQRERLAALEKELEIEIEKIAMTPTPEDLQLEPIRIPPRKSDILIDRMGLGWTPWQVKPCGLAEPLY